MVEHPEKQTRLAAASTDNQAEQTRVAEIEAEIDAMINKRTEDKVTEPVVYEFASADRACCAEIARRYRAAGWVARVRWSASEDERMRPTLALS